MRVGLGGYDGPLPPLALELQHGVPFLKAPYVAMGYTDIDIMCIGAAGGTGARALGDSPTYNPLYVWGGAGGAGGVHLVKRKLVTLPDSCAVVVGAAGLDNAKVNTKSSTTWVSQKGTDGLPSTFGGSICQAGGGGGGNSGTFSDPAYSQPSGFGGNGGVGNTTAAGTGPLGGGKAGSSPPLPPTTGGSGTWDGTIGSGGGGGAGGSYNIARSNGGTFIFAASNAGDSHVSGSDPTVTSPREPKKDTLAIVTQSGSTATVIPGFPGGARSTPLTLKSTVYGTRAFGAPGHGAVIVRLTQQ